MKRFTFKQGKVLQVASHDGRYGYIIALDRDSMGTLFAVVKTVFDGPVPPERLHTLRNEPSEPAYLNTSRGLAGPRSTHEWVVAGEIQPTTFQAVFFYGSQYTGMTIRFPNGTEEFVPGPIDLVAFEDRMFKCGYFQEVLWLPDDIADFIFEKKPLRWSAHKQY